MCLSEERAKSTACWYPGAVQHVVVHPCEKVRGPFVGVMCWCSDKFRRSHSGKYWLVVGLRMMVQGGVQDGAYAMSLRGLLGVIEKCQGQSLHCGCNNTLELPPNILIAPTLDIFESSVKSHLFALICRSTFPLFCFVFLLFVSVSLHLFLSPPKLSLGLMQSTLIVLEGTIGLSKHFGKLHLGSLR